MNSPYAEEIIRRLVEGGGNNDFDIGAILDTLGGMKAQRDAEPRTVEPNEPPSGTDIQNKATDDALKNIAAEMNQAAALDAARQAQQAQQMQAQQPQPDPRQLADALQAEAIKSALKREETGVVAGARDEAPSIANAQQRTVPDAMYEPFKNDDSNPGLHNAVLNALNTFNKIGSETRNQKDAEARQAEDERRQKLNEAANQPTPIDQRQDKTQEDIAAVMNQSTTTPSQPPEEKPSLFAQILGTALPREGEPPTPTPQPEANSQPLTTPMKREVINAMIQYKLQWDQADAILQQVTGLEDADVQKQFGMSKEEAIKQATAAKAQAHEAANVLRQRAEAWGIDLSGYENASSEGAWNNLQTQQGRELAEYLAHNNKYSAPADQFQKNTFLRMVMDGMPIDQAQAVAGYFADDYRNQQSNYLNDLARTYGLDGTYLNGIGVQLLRDMVNAGDESAEVYGKMFNSPKDYQTRMNTIEDTIRSHVFGFEDRDDMFRKNVLTQTIANWSVVNKVDTKSDRGEKIFFKNVWGKKIDGGMRTLAIVKALNILKKRKL